MLPHFLKHDVWHESQIILLFLFHVAFVVCVIVSDDIFWNAVQEGSGLFQYGVVIMNGPPGAGKTSVKQLLLGRPCLTQEEQNSTSMYGMNHI